MCSTWVTPGEQAWQPDLDSRSEITETKIEIVAAADEVQHAAFLVSIERHAQARGQLLDEFSVFVDHLRGPHDMACAVGPAIFAIPGHALRFGANPHERFDVVAGPRRHRRADQRAQPREHPAEPACANDLERARIVGRGGGRRSARDRFGRGGSTRQSPAPHAPHDGCASRPFRVSGGVSVVAWVMWVPSVADDLRDAVRPCASS